MNKSIFPLKSLSLLIGKIAVMILGIWISSFLCARIGYPAYMFKDFNKDSLIKISGDLFFDRWFVPVMISKLDFDTLIAGSSMVANLSMSKIDKAFNVSSVNASMKGCYLFEQYKAVAFALSQKNLSNVIWGIDFNSLGLPCDYILESIPFPEYLFRPTKLSKFLYCSDIRTNRFSVTSQIVTKVKGFNTWEDFPNISAKTILADWEEKRRLSSRLLIR